MNTAKIKTSDLTGAALDWAVTACELRRQHGQNVPIPSTAPKYFNPSTDWAQGGPIIEREKIAIDCDDEGLWVASYNDKPVAYYGPTPLIAAMRAFVASQLGDEVEIPTDLANSNN